MAERRPTNSELRLERLTAREQEQEQESRGILEIFDEREETHDADAPLARAEDESDTR